MSDTLLYQQPGGRRGLGRASGWSGRARLIGAMICLGMPVTSAWAAEVAFRDDFDGALGEGWTFVRENPDLVSLEARPGFLQIETERGTIGAEGQGVNNLLLRPFTGNFIIETRIEADPETGQQYAGLIVYVDDDNAVSIGLGYAAGERGVFRGVVMLTVANGEVPAGTPPVAFYDADNAVNPNAVYLRLLRSGNQFVGGYSTDGLVYNDIGTITNDLADEVFVGLGAANGDSTTCGVECDVSIPADFDFFQLSTISGDSGGSPDVQVVLTEVEITGPAEAASGAAADFVAVAHFSDDTSLDATADAEWTVAPAGYAEIVEGRLTVGQVAAERQITLVATYTQLTSGGEITERGTAVVRLTPPATLGGGLCGAGATAAILMVAPLLPAVRRGRRSEQRAKN